MAKVMSGNYFEDFEIGQRLRHATPRTVTEGDVALYQALYGSRFAVSSGATATPPSRQPPRIARSAAIMAPAEKPR